MRAKFEPPQPVDFNPNERIIGKDGHIYFAYTGLSMFPTFRAFDWMELKVVDPASLIPGDVIIFRRHEDERLVVHRVLAVEAGGLRTQGDNNRHPDTWVLRPEDVMGKVVHVRRQGKRLLVWNGRAGQFLPAWYTVLWSLDRWMMHMTGPVFDWLGRTKVLARILHPLLRPKVAFFMVNERRVARLLVRGRVVGQFDPNSRRWLMDRGYRYLIDPVLLNFDPEA